MIIPACKQRVAVAFVAAFILVVQSLGGVWAKATPTPLDAFGNPLCVNNEVGGGSGHSGDQRTAGGCCTLACNWTGTVLPPPDVFFDTQLFRLISEPIGNIHSGSVLPRYEGMQGNPRAPPA